MYNLRKQSVTYSYIWENGKVITVLDAERNTYNIAYDNSGRVSTLTLPDGEKTLLTYTANKTTVTKKTSSNAVILTEHMEWNNQGNIIAYTDSAGKVTTYVYENNLLKSTTIPIEWQTIENGKVVIHTETKTSAANYNEEGNIKEESDINGNLTTYIYGDNNNSNLVTKELTKNGNTIISNTTYTYDETGRVLEEKDIVADTASIYSYDDTPEQNEEGKIVNTTEKQDSSIISEGREEYDEEGNLIAEENTSGGITTSSENIYDEMGNILQSVSSDGTKIIYTYDFLGRQLSQKNYDKNGTLVQTTQSDYYANGEVKNEIAANGSISNYTYDNRNRVIKKIVTAEGNSRTWKTSYTYDNISVKNGKGTATDTIANAAKVTEEDPTGSQTITWTDASGQTVRETANGLNNDTRYDSNGNGYITIVSAMNDGSISSVNLSLYNKDGNQTDTIVNPGYENNEFIIKQDSIHTSKNYDEKNNVTSDIDALGNQTNYTYDDSGNLITVLEDGVTTSYRYDTEEDGDSKTTTTRANGGTSTTVEDGGGRTLYTLDKGADKEIRTSYKYDDEGILTKQINADGSYLLYQYDSQGRQETVLTYNANGINIHKTQYSYDDFGHVIAMKDYEGNNIRYTGYAYNDFDELVNYWEVDGTDSPSADEKAAHLITYNYNGDGSLISVNYADNSNGVNKLSYTYNALKQLTEIIAIMSDGRNRTVSEYSYTSDGKVTKRKDYLDFAGTGNQYVERIYTYDNLNRVISMTYKKDGETKESHAYTYDKNSHILGEDSNLNWDGQEAIREVKNYTYDNKGQLTKSVLTDENQLQTTTEYTYDNVGNRTKEVKNQNGKSSITTSVYNELDQLLSSAVKENNTNISSITYAYDANGNLKTAKDDIADTEITYNYDPEGQLKQLEERKSGAVVLSQENSYNGEGQRIKKMEGESNTAYFYQNGILLMTENGEGDLKTFEYLGISGNPLFTMRTSDTTNTYYNYQKDIQGSTRVLTDKNSSSAEWYTYTDFGETTIHEEIDGFENEICYTGGVYDESTKLYYLNARYYNPETGRFLTRDSYRGESNRPDTLHLYLYCANDPVNYVDPSGHFFDVAIDIVSVGWSAYDMLKDPSFKNAAYLVYDVAAAVLPYVPSSKTYKAIDSLKGAVEMGTKASKVAKGVKTSQKVSYMTGKLGENALRRNLRKGGNKGLVQMQKYFTTYIGGQKKYRIVDAFSRGIAHESKVGYTSYTKRVREELAKDKYLLKNNSLVHEVTWHFYRSKVTGKIGASKKLIQELRKAHINVVFHF